MPTATMQTATAPRHRPSRPRPSSPATSWSVSGCGQVTPSWPSSVPSPPSVRPSTSPPRSWLSSRSFPPTGPRPTTSEVGDGGPGRRSRQRLLEVDDVPVPAELAALLAEVTRLGEAEASVQRHRRLVGQGDASDGAMNILTVDGPEEPGIQAAAQPHADGVRCQIDGGLDRRLVRLARAVGAGAGEAEELGAGDGYEDAESAGMKGPEAASLLAQGSELLTEDQDRLFAQASRGVLLVLQGPDAAGKNSTIKHVMRGIDPQGVDVRSFSGPSAEELRHDFLWRCQRALPERGRIGVFNRSHYEEVLVVRVHPELLVPQRLPELPRGDSLWKRRYREINEWERYLVDNGTRVVKVLLNLSRTKQAERLRKRIDDPAKHWKFSADDIRDRRSWDEYQRAYSAMLSHTSTEWAPWYVVPADRKWFARLATAAVLAETLVDLDPRYPQVTVGAKQEMEKAKGELEAELRPTEHVATD